MSISIFEDIKHLSALSYCQTLKFKNLLLEQKFSNIRRAATVCHNWKWKQILMVNQWEQWLIVVIEMPRKKMQRKVVIKENFTEENRVCVKTCDLYITFQNEDKRQEQLCKSFQNKIYLEYMSLIKPQIPVLYVKMGRYKGLISSFFIYWITIQIYSLLHIRVLIKIYPWKLLFTSTKLIC